MAATKRTKAVKKAVTRRLSKKRIKLGNISVTQKQLLVGGIVAALLAVGLYFGRTEKVAITVAINAEYGGVFADPNECDPLPEYRKNLEEISVASSTGEVIPMTEITWVSTEKNVCEGTFTLTLSPLSTYDVALKGEKIGSIGEANYASSTAVFEETIAVTRDLTGTFTLRDTADTCTGTFQSWTCYWDYTFLRNFDWNIDDRSCWGLSGYDDLRDGSAVKVYDSTGKIVGSTTLNNSEYNLDSVSSRKLTCTFKWELNDIPNDDQGYSVEISNRGEVYFSLDSLKDSGFFMGTEIGK